MGKYNDVTHGQTEAAINRMGGYENWKRFIGGAGRIVFDLLTPCRELTLAGRSAFTTTEQSFTDAGVNWVGDNFKAQFIGLAVAETSEETFLVSNLESNSLCLPIISELGGSEKAETSVAHFIELLVTNKSSSEAFNLYLRGKDGNLWAVTASCCVGGEGWSVRVNSISDPGVWCAGLGVVSRK